MIRPITSASPHRSAPPAGYTLVEILVATALTLLLMGAVVTMFGQIGTSITNSRAVLEMSDRLRATAARLQLDLKFATATPRPPLRPEQDQGYTEIIEGPFTTFANNAVNSGAGNAADTTVGDTDDILMLTVRSPGKPFVGRCNDMPAQSEVAEVAWFLRGRTLYRRQLLVVPSASFTTTTSFYYHNDISVHPAYNASGAFAGVVANTLGDLTKRECRYAHPWTSKPPSLCLPSGGFPFDARVWGPLRLPTLRECSDPNWVACNTFPAIPPYPAAVDYWSQTPCPWSTVVPPDNVTGTLDAFNKGTRIAEDVILTNVIGFDVKVWDPGAPVMKDAAGNVLVPGDMGYPPTGGTTVSLGAFVDLGWANLPWATATSPFNHLGNPKSQLLAITPPANPPYAYARVYDTWSFHYEHDGIDENGDGIVDSGTNGYDDDGNGVVDDMNEWETMPPYPAPLRAVQIKIRVFEPDSRQIREVTVEQDFLPK